MSDQQNPVPYIPGPTRQHGNLPPSQTLLLPTASTKKSNKMVPIAVGIILGVVALCVTLTVVVAISGNGDNKKNPIISATTNSPVVTTVPTTPFTAKVVKPSDFTLKVKTLKKECFGSAGCNVVYEIRADWNPAIFGDIEECEVTYQVNGLEDPQINTLTARSDGKYEFDSDEIGSTTSSSKKLTAKPIEVECE